jgi:hypothetical protein
MKRFGLVTAALFVAAVALVSNANAMPQFVRQTGLTCNQCHITQIGTPDFTFTGKKFRLNGYRAPYVAEKIEAGEEGALNGRRLMLGLISPLAFRVGQTFLSQSKGASQVVNGVTVPTTATGVTTRPYSNWAMFYNGAIGDHIGFWNETYFTARNNDVSNIYRLNGMDEWDLRFVWNPGYDNIIGLATTTQAFSYLAGFGPARSGAAGQGAIQRGGTPGSAHTPYANIAAYALLKDRFLVVAGIQGGEDNYDLSGGAAYQLLLGAAISNSDYNQLWANVQVKAGNDAIPIVTNTSMDVNAVNWTYSDAFTGVSATRGATSATRVSYMAADIGDFVRSTAEVEYSFVDRGPHSLWSSCGVAINRETYADGAGIKQQGLGCSVRYLYNRTFGFSKGISRYLKNEFTDKNGLVHPISQQKFDALGELLSWTLRYKPAMNFSIGIGLSAAQGGGGGRLDDTRVYNKDGWSWSFSFDFQF